MYSFVDITHRNRWMLLAFVGLCFLVAVSEGQNDDLPCLYLGQLHLHGQEWVANPCSNCTCWNSTTTCISITCEIPNCKDAYIPKGKCCQECPPNVVITDIQVDIPPDGMTIEGLTGNKVTFDVTALYNDVTTAVTGENLWRLNVFGSKSPDGSKGKKHSLVRNALNEEQVQTPVTLGSPLTFLDVMTEIDMKNLLCEDITHLCVKLLKNPKSKPKFDFKADPPEATATCTPLPCKGVIVTGNEVSVPAGTMVQENNPLNPVSLGITYQTDPQGSTIFGEDLWDLELYANTKPDGTGDSLPINSQALSPDQQDKHMGGGVPGEFSPISANVDLTGVTCDKVPYICMTLSKGSKPSREFTLTGDPDEGVFTGCASIPCKPNKQLTVTDTDLDLKEPKEVEEGKPSNPLNFDVDVTSDPTSSDIEGDDLWKLKTLLSSSPDGSTDREILSEDVLNPVDKGKGLPSDDTITFPDLESNVDMTNKKCDEAKYFCVELSKDPAANPDYEMKGEPENFIDCKQLDCKEAEKELTVTDTDLDLKEPKEVEEGKPSNPLNFDVDVTSDPTSSDIEGDDLWKLKTLLSSSPDGSTDRDILSEDVLNPVDKGKGLPSDDTITFPDLESNVDMTNKKCDEAKYFCVELSKDPAANPDYEMKGEPENFIDCKPLDCKEEEKKPVDVTETDLKIAAGDTVKEGKPSNVIDFDVTLTTDPDEGDAEGDDIWKATTFTSTSPDGSTDRNPLDEQALAPYQADTDVPAGDSTTFYNLQANVDMSTLKCDEVDYLCVEVHKGDFAYPDYDLKGRLSDCVPLKCIEGGDTVSISLKVVCGPSLF
ncbi:uncharacterized protein [Ptychodera flava]|uniref:uncharacterized protein isoform X1 n=1 Tax=Ptychodera flava TaxID=63121 RepID=UPI00396A6394